MRTQKLVGIIGFCAPPHLFHFSGSLFFCDEIKKGLDLFSRAMEHVEQLPKDFTPSTSFSANVKSLEPSGDPYNVSSSEMREFMANKALQEESGSN